MKLPPPSPTVLEVHVSKKNINENKEIKSENKVTVDYATTPPPFGFS